MHIGLDSTITDHLEAACPAQPLPLPAASAASASVEDSPQLQPGLALPSTTRAASLDLKGGLDLEGADTLLMPAGSFTAYP